MTTADQTRERLREIIADQQSILAVLQAQAATGTVATIDVLRQRIEVRRAEIDLLAMTHDEQTQ